MHLKVMTPARLYVDEVVEFVTIPTKMGQVTALPGHDFVITVLKEGKLYFNKRKGEKPHREDYLIVGDGCAEITNDEVMVFTKSVKREEVLNGDGKDTAW
ncbi:MAG: F0F1 ATP synthase subunit epsilon [Deltaproteobacteria bacterium]|jgi:F0F1-type ATP synthase epsilon subunit|nr:F0F1 ATP synthase subunit epsilon [Deltaproteobacteria bacterium]